MKFINVNECFWFDHSQNLLEMLLETLWTIGVNLHFAFLENVDSLLSWNLDYLLAWGEYFFVDLFSYFDLKFLCPVAHVKQAWLQYSLGVFTTDLFSQIIMKFAESSFFLFWS